MKKEKVKEAVIVFTRYPEPGKSKTRLSPTLGYEGAANLQRRMTSRTLINIRSFINHHPANIEVHFDGGTKQNFREWLGSDLDYRLQGNGDIGARMLYSFKTAFNKGTTAAVMVGTDCPGLNSSILQSAFDALKLNDLVLGPASDGGYYLIGLNQKAQSKSLETLFTNISWGSSEVFERTIKAADDVNISYTTVDKLVDIDRPEDLHIWEETLEADKSKKQHPDISVIIPALNEEDNIASTIASAQSAPNAEIIVVDGGSNDNTRKISRAAGAIVSKSKPGRACQMNVGAAAAVGDILLFLHADTLLPYNYDRWVELELSRDSVVCGAFELKLDKSGILLNLIEKTANFRSRRWSLPYGDQAIFIRRDLFNAIGGYKEMPIMEDVELIRRLRLKGKIAIVPVPVLTSTRRYSKCGPLKTTIINKIAMLLYNLGFPPAMIARLCKRKLA